LENLGRDERAWQQCIALYNTLRESPKDSVLLNRLLEMYAGMREFQEALAAGRHFPDALSESAQCLTTYGKVNLAAGNPAEALRYLRMAVQKNKMAEVGRAQTCAGQNALGPGTKGRVLVTERK